ncbi:hypothetical protein BAMA_04820 [Bacillus manliponensis]|uniref:Uncharacterized protein n=1 Tax=Bacillus manliponensis TaxID=574376 RepID=A0A073JWA9_9BACI|nr:hypothetical protein [Bacillus manliponensis]KEK18580.1 hypothetical protein BAMA_04820 [Bacillus manliponensis]
MIDCVSLLESYVCEQLSLDEFLDSLFDLAVRDFRDKENSTSVNDCIKIVFISTNMHKELDKFIEKYLVIKPDSEIFRYDYFPINASTYDVNGDLPIVDRLKAEMRDAIYLILLGTIETKDKKEFKNICSDWEEVFFIIWASRVEEVKKSFALAHSKREI